MALRDDSLQRKSVGVSLSKFRIGAWAREGFFLAVSVRCPEDRPGLNCCTKEGLLYCELRGSRLPEVLITALVETMSALAAVLTRRKEMLHTKQDKDSFAEKEIIVDSPWRPHVVYDLRLNYFRI